MKIGSLSLTIIFEFPCSFWTVSINETFLMSYGRKYYTTILPKITISPTMFFYQMRRSVDSLPNICSLSLFSNQIEDDKMNCEPTKLPKQENNSFQFFPMKIGSLSLTIICWFPCSFWTMSMNSITTILAVKRWERKKVCILGDSINNHNNKILFFWLE